MVVSVIFFIWISVTTILGLSNPIVRHISMASSATVSKESFYLAEAGIEDIVYRLKSGKPVGASQVLSINGNSVTTTVVDELGGKKINSLANNNNFIRKVETHLTLGTGVSFHYGIQSGRGGFVLQNSSSITGNVYSEGSVVGAGNYIYGDVISAGSSGLVYGIHATGTAFAHTIGSGSQSTIIDKDAYYVTKTGTVNVAGSLHPGSPDQPTVPLPISDAQISQWESDALAGGTISGASCSGGTYTITSNITLGPKKIDCDLLVKGNDVTLTIAGPIWVAGNITTQTGPVIRMAASLGSQNVPLIADKPSSPTTSGIITIGQNTQFYGSGTANSFVFAISQNTSAESGGSTNAINMGQSAGALVVYASHGQITLGQSVGVKEATAYKIVLTNTANVVYDTGLPNTLFSAGPSGGFEIASWKEVP